MRRFFLFSLFTVFVLGRICPAESAEIQTIAGTGEKEYSGDGGVATGAELNNPFGIIVGPDGDIYFCDTGNHAVRKISRKTGKIETIAGTGEKGYSGDGGPATEAELFEPYEVRFHPDGDLYWVEMQNHLVRKLDARTGKIETVAGSGEKGFGGDGGKAIRAKMNRPHSIQFDRSGEHLYICDIGNHRIRRVDLAKGTIKTWCGTGKPEPTEDGAKVGSETPLKGPRALDIAPNGDFWLALREGNLVYRIDMKTGTLHHAAGTGEKGFEGNGGPAKKATLSGPKGVAISPDGKLIYLADTESHSVRAIDLRNDPPTLELIAGDGEKGDGPDSPDPLKCRMARLHGVGVDPVTGDLYIGDSETNKVRKISGLSGGKSPAAFSAFEKEDFEVDGRKCTIVKPKQPAPGKPWIWRCRFLGAFPQVDAALLEQGWHVATIDVANLFGAPEAMKAFDAFYEEITGKRGFAAKPIIEGFSRGGLPALNWSIANPEKVTAIYLDAPVIDIHTWPKQTSPGLWPVCLKAYGLTEENADTWKGPLENLSPLAKAKVPILSVCGGVDKPVPFSENTGKLETRYRKLGGPIDVIVKATCDHHPHSLYDPTPIVNWIGGKMSVQLSEAATEKLKSDLEKLTESAVSDPDYRKKLIANTVSFYEALEFRPAFSPGTTKNSGAFRQSLDAVLERHAVSSETAPKFDSTFNAGASGIPAADLQTALVFLDRACRLRHGPPEAGPLWVHYGSRVKSPDSREWIAAMAETVRDEKSKPASALESAAPQHPIYRALLKQYHQLRPKLEKAGDDFQLLTLPSGSKSVRVGNSWADVPILIERLRADGFLNQKESGDDGETAQPEGEDDSTIYTKDLAEAVKAFQESNHLGADGIIGQQTIASLNLGPAEKLSRLKLNLQRARHLPDQLENRAVFVNLPSGQLEGFTAGKREITMRVVFGQARDGRRTPIFHDEMQYVVFRPYWRVPPGIVTKEIAPETRKDPDEWYRKGYEIVNGFGDGKSLPPTWDNLEAAARGELRIRQRPGHGNALGLVKFLFPNDHSVYMHDTPVKHLFSQGRRDHSHGCIRLQHPQKMAEWALGPQGWETSRIEEALSNETRRSITLDERIAVYIVYFTAWPDLENGGRIAWLPDVYGRDTGEWDNLTLASKIASDEAASE